MDGVVNQDQSHDSDLTDILSLNETGFLWTPETTAINTNTSIQRQILKEWPWVAENAALTNCSFVGSGKSKIEVKTRQAFMSYDDIIPRRPFYTTCLYIASTVPPRSTYPLDNGESR